MMKRFLAIAALALASVLPSSAATSISLQAAQMTQPTSSVGDLSWVAPDPNNAPAGAWRIPLETSISVSSTVSLGQVVAPGTYAVFLSVLDYDSYNSVQFILGNGTSVTEVLDDRDGATKYWTTNVTVTTSVSTTNLVVIWTRTGVAHFEYWMGLYLTSDTNEVVLKDDRVMTFRYPGTADNDNSTAVAGNHFPNSSFEAGGLGTFWRAIQSSPARTNSLRSMWSTDFAWHGTHSLKIICPEPAGQSYADSNPITLASNKVHTISVYARTASGTQSAVLYLQSLYETPSGFSTTYTTNTGATVGTSWTRLTVTTTNLPYYPNGQYFIRLGVQKVSGGAVYWDGLQVEEGATATTWAPMLNCEFDASLSEPTRVIWNTDTPTATFTMWNNSAGSLTRKIDWKLLNWNNQTVSSGSTNITATSSNIGTAVISVPVSTNGHFRLDAGITNQNSDVELTWLVVPPPPTTGLDPDSMFGGLMDATPWTLATMQRLGVKWQCSLSPGRFRIEENKTNYAATGSSYVWPDFSSFTNYGVSVLGVLYSASQPTWLTNVTDFTNAPVCSDYLLRAITNYPYITNWEIWNEPPGILPSIAYYTELLRITATAVKATHPTIGIVGAGGVSTADIVTNIIGLLGADTNKVDRYALHFYPSGTTEPGNEGGAATVRTKVLTPYGFDTWNTESGEAPQYGGLIGPRSAFRTAGRYAVPFQSANKIYTSFTGGAAGQAKNFLTCMGYGMTKMFYHDFGYRNISGGDFTSAQWTAYDYDESMRPVAAVVAGLFSVLDKVTGRGTVNGANAGITALAFQRGTASFVTVWSTNNYTLTLAPSITTGQVHIWDVMGNLSEPSTLALAVGQMPIIVGHSSVNFSNLCHSFSNAVVSGRLDTTAPWLQITECPKEAIATIPTHIRWLAFDDSGTPEVLRQTRIEYRYKLDSGSFSDWSGDTWVNYDAISGNHTFTVQARDDAQNISVATATIGEEVAPDPPATPAASERSFVFSDTVLAANSAPTLLDIAGLCLWVDVSQATNTTYAGGITNGSIVNNIFKDLSPANHHTGASGGTGMVYVATGGGGDGLHSYIALTNHNSAPGNQVGTDATDITNSSTFTLVTVMKPIFNGDGNTYTTGYWGYTDYNTGSGCTAGMNFNSGNGGSNMSNTNAYNIASGADLESDNGSRGTNWQVVACVSNGTNSSIWLNGVKIKTGTCGTSFPLKVAGPSFCGWGGVYYGGAHTHWILFERGLIWCHALTDSDVVLASQICMNDFGITP